MIIEGPENLFRWQVLTKLDKIELKLKLVIALEFVIILNLLLR